MKQLNKIMNFTNQLDNMSSCHDKETQWYTPQCKLSTKRNIYFYKLNTRQTG